jgi:hypothetical protein
MSAIGKVAKFVTNVFHHICMQHMQLRCNFTKKTFVQLQCNYYATIVTMSCWHCISSIHDDELCSFLWQLLCNHRCNENTLRNGITLPLGDNYFVHIIVYVCSYIGSPHGDYFEIKTMDVYCWVTIRKLPPFTIVVH